MLVGLCLATVSAAMADIKITATVTVVGGARNETKKVVTYYKGSLIRTETDSGVSIYDAKAQTITSYRTGEKVYRLLSLKDTMTKLPGMMARVKVTSSANVQPLPDTATIAGMPAKKYIGTAAIQIGTEGMPNGGPTTHIEIEQWMTESVTLDSEITPLQQVVGPLNQFGGMEPVAQAFGKMKGLPLSSRVKITMEGSRSAAPEIVTTTQVQAVDESPLSDDLFKVPEGYTLQPVRNPVLPTNKKGP